MKFFAEFKKFITRGNVVDMAVGVIVGSSFTAIVNALSNNILKPLVNWLLALAFGANSISELYTPLTAVYDEAGNLDLTQSIYIDWGTFINAIINFFLIALVLFTIVKLINKLREGHNQLADDLKKHKPSKEERAEMKARGIKLSDRDAVKAYYDEKAAKEAEAKAAADAAAAEKAKADREANPTAEDLLKEILATLKKA
jgi:large conductance mechanosensitive channel